MQSMSLSQRLRWRLSACRLQVYKLLTPHFMFTLRMNANARTTLTNVTGILEVNSRRWQTPGHHSVFKCCSTQRTYARAERNNMPWWLMATLYATEPAVASTCRPRSPRAGTRWSSARRRTRAGSSRSRVCPTTLLPGKPSLQDLL